LCAGASLTGPGDIYRLHFTANNTATSGTAFTWTQAEFADAGIEVTPVTSTGTSVEITSGGGGGCHGGCEYDPKPTPSPTWSLMKELYK
jgi:hypothetical protein